MKHTCLMRIWLRDKNAITHTWSITASNNNDLMKKKVCFHAWQKVISTNHYNNACVHVSMDIGCTITYSSRNAGATIKQDVHVKTQKWDELMRMFKNKMNYRG